MHMLVCTEVGGGEKEAEPRRREEEGRVILTVRP